MMDDLTDYLNKQRCAGSAYQAALAKNRYCAICGASVGSLNGADGELPLALHYREKHPDEKGGMRCRL